MPQTHVGRAFDSVSYDRGFESCRWQWYIENCENGNLWLWQGSTEVEHLTDHPKIKGLNPIMGNRRENNAELRQMDIFLTKQPNYMVTGLYHKTYYGRNLRFP